MLKILFSPSEGKVSGGNNTQDKELLGSNKARKEILDNYNEIIKRADPQEISKLFGIKKLEECQSYLQDIFSAPKLEAIRRYSGVAYEYLAYDILPSQAQEYLKANTIIFSNLYGPLRGSDKIANYKVKQGNNIGGIEPDKFYKDRFSYQLDLYLGKDDILDLRAGYYDKFYKVSRPYTTLKFLKNGKTVSHWAKAYRGIVLRELAKHDIQNLEAFGKLEIEGLDAEEIKVIKNKTEIVYNILS
ncbi:MAG: YaaA family protein [Helicobacteraceae bacterium]|nr:YaaA family protein [Helicobacteraceae bacterium]